MQLTGPEEIQGEAWLSRKGDPHRIVQEIKIWPNGIYTNWNPC